MSFTSGPQTILGSTESQNDQQHAVLQFGTEHGLAEDNSELHKMVEITGNEDFEMKRPPYYQVSWILFVDLHPCLQNYRQCWQAELEEPVVTY